VTVSSTRDLRELLVRKGVRPTRQRLLVLEELAAERDDATAQTLWQRLRGHDEGVGLATVYRTLTLLHDHGVVDALSHHGSERCYRLCADGHHHHLLCERCHRVVEIDECTLGPWVEDVARRHGFVASDHHVEINGLCGACLTVE
jgi:Fur family transcriptional regulator, ferric uptake regulator